MKEEKQVKCEVLDPDKQGEVETDQLSAPDAMTGPPVADWEADMSGMKDRFHQTIALTEHNEL